LWRDRIRIIDIDDKCALSKRLWGKTYRKLFEQFKQYIIDGVETREKLLVKTEQKQSSLSYEQAVEQTSFPFKRRSTPYQQLPLFEQKDSGGREVCERITKMGWPEDLTGKSVLDLGCNAGAFCIEAARRGASVTGVEVNSETVKFAQNMCEQLNVNVDFICGSLDDEATLEKILRKDYDIILALSIVKHVHAKKGFFELLNKAKSTIYYETHAKQSLKRGLLDLSRKLNVLDSFDITDVHCQTDRGDRLLITLTKRGS